MRFVRDNKLLCFLIFAVVVASVGLTLVSQRVYDAQRSVQKAGRDVVRVEWDIRSLKAELAYLTRPDRLDRISSNFVQSIAPAAGGYDVPASTVSFSSSLSSLPEAISPASFDAPLPNKKPVKSKPISVNKKSSFDDLLNGIGGRE